MCVSRIFSDTKDINVRVPSAGSMWLVRISLSLKTRLTFLPLVVPLQLLWSLYYSFFTAIMLNSITSLTTQEDYCWSWQLTTSLVNCFQWSVRVSHSSSKRYLFLHSTSYKIKCCLSLIYLLHNLVLRSIIFCVSPKIIPWCYVRSWMKKCYG